MARVLVVDDDQASARLVAKYLQRAGYQVTLRHDGQSGLDRALASPPDLILLDVMMPGLDGLAVCRALREAESTRELPVIFLSARGDLSDRVAGLDEGATDYLVKPFVPDDLLARVRAALRTKQLQDELRRVNANLRRLERGRHELVTMLAHDIRGLLGAASAAVEMARVDLEDLPERDATRFLAIADRNTAELIDLTTNLLDCYRLEEGRLRLRRGRVDLRAVADDVVDRFGAQAASKQTALDVRGDPVEAVVGDTDLVRRVLLNLVSNALKFTPSGGRVTVDLDSHLKPPSGREGVVVAVQDAGPGIAATDQDQLFVRFSPLARASGRRHAGSGLGLAFCRQVVELHGGEIWVESEPGRGSTFAFLLPRVDGSVPTPA